MAGAVALATATYTATTTPPRPLRAAVVYLTTTRPKDLAELKVSLHATWENFLVRFPQYPVLVVHEGDFTPAHEREVRDAAPVGLSLEVIHEPHFEPPPHVSALIEAGTLEPSFMSWKAREDKTHFGYNNMIRWMVRGIFEHPLLGSAGGLEYYMRLDTDSRLLSPLPEDPFELMRRDGLKYMFYDTLDDVKRYSSGLVLLAEEHARRGGAAGGEVAGGGEPPRPSPIEPAWPAAWAHALANRDTPPSFYNNIEFGETAFFRRPDVQALVKRIDADGGIYRHRWGDATIRWLTLSLFARPDQVRGFCNFDYDHDGRVRREDMRCRRPGNNPSQDLSCVCFQYSQTEVWRPKKVSSRGGHTDEL